MNNLLNATSKKILGGLLGILLTLSIANASEPRRRYNQLLWIDRNIEETLRKDLKCFQGTYLAFLFMDECGIKEGTGILMKTESEGLLKCIEEGIRLVYPNCHFIKSKYQPRKGGHVYELVEKELDEDFICY